MKNKTFTYNEIIKFFNGINLPLSKNQIEAIHVKQREEIVRIEDYKKKREEEKNKKILKRLKRKEWRENE